MSTERTPPSFNIGLIHAKPLTEGTWRIYYANGVLIGEAVLDVDGYYYFWPTSDRQGAWTAGVLHDVANFLDRINEAWDKQIRSDPKISSS